MLVSTGTKNLQEQIYFKDLPALAEALAVKFNACLHEGAHQLSVPASARSGAREHGARPARFHRRVGRRRTETGDRAELHDLPDDSGIWSEIAATAETCLGTECPQYQQCFVTRMRQRAAESDVVVVNHHLLCADAAVRQSSYGEVIPEIGNLVIDEAHQLEDVATQYFGISVSNYRLDELVRDSERVLRSAAVSDAARRAARAVSRVGDHARAFFGGDRHGAPAARALGEERLRIGPDWFGDIVDDGVALRTALDGLEAVMALAGAADSGRRTRAQRGRADAGAPRRRESATICSSCSRRRTRRFVYFVETRGRGVFLRAAPIDVVGHRSGARVRTDAIDGADVGDARRCRVVRVRPRAARHRRTPASCAYRRNSTSRGRACSTCRAGCRRRSRPSLPMPSRVQVHAILRATEGRAFVLFTSYADDARASTSD